MVARRRKQRSGPNGNSGSRSRWLIGELHESRTTTISKAMSLELPLGTGSIDERIVEIVLIVRVQEVWWECRSVGMTACEKEMLMSKSVFRTRIPGERSRGSRQTNDE